MNDVNILKNNGVNIEKSLSLLGDMSLYNETLDTFISEIEVKVKNLIEFKDANDMYNYSILVHSLKSEANYLGFDNLSNIAFNHEKASKMNDSNFVNQNFSELILELNKIMQICKQYKTSSTVVNEPVTTNSKGKILVVDDSNIIRNFVKKIFNDEYEVLMAENGNQAIEMVTNNDISCMLLDLNMPECNGFEVLEYLKANSLFKKTPVSLLTGDDAKESIQNAFKYPIVDMVSKPFNESDVKAIVEKMISIHNFN